MLARRDSEPVTQRGHQKRNSPAPTPTPGPSDMETAGQAVGESCSASGEPIPGRVRPGLALLASLWVNLPGSALGTRPSHPALQSPFLGAELFRQQSEEAESRTGSQGK